MGLLDSNTFDPEKDVPDLTGKVYVVTGGSAGIGFGIVAHLLSHNADKIYLLSNKEEHAEEAIEGLRKYGDSSKVEWKKCQLASLKHTDEVAKSLASLLERLDGLVCNAGVGVGKYSETEDGIDSHMQVNVVSQAHLAMMLLPILQKTPNSRLVLQSSDLHRGATDSAQFESLEELNRDIGPTKLYNRTKLAQILFLKALVQRAQHGRLGFKPEQLKAQGPWMNATHPGAVSTDQQEQAIDAYGKLGQVGVAMTRPFMKDPESQGCRSALFAATSEEVEKEKIQGEYIVPDKKVTKPSQTALDGVLQENLWKLTFDILRTKLGDLSYDTK